MPELPEVETLRRQLHPCVVGRRIEDARVSRARAIRAHASAEEFQRLVRGATILDICRRGKALLLPLDNGRTLLVRLGMSGRLMAVASEAPALPHTHVVLALSDGGELRFIDPRTFGQVAVVEGHDPACMLELGHYGLEPLGEAFTPKALAAVLAGRKVLIDHEKFLLFPL